MTWWRVAMCMGVLAASPSTAEARVKCTTAQHRVHQRHVLFSNADRPSKSMVLRSADGRASVHWNPAEATQSHAALALQLLDDALRVEVDDMGWPAPIPDRDYGGDSGVDLYFDPQPDGSAYTAPDTEDPDLNRDSNMAYIVLDTEISDEEMPYFIFHELNHVLQFGADAAEADGFFEASASFMEYVTQPEAVIRTDYLPAFQGAPSDAMDDYTHTDSYEYGYALFLFFISQRYFNGSPDIVRDLWVDSTQLSTGDVYVNEPDYLDVLQQRLPGVSLSDVLAEFSRWRSYVGDLDDGQHIALPGVLPLNSEMRAARTTNSSALPVTTNVQLAETGSALVLVDVRNGFNRGIHVQVAGGNDTDDLVEVSLLSTDSAFSTVHSATARAGEPVADVETAGATQVRVLVARLGNGAHDPDDEEWDAHAFTIVVEAVDVPDGGFPLVLPDAGSSSEDASVGSGGDAPPEDTKRGCGCGASEASPLVLVMLGWMLSPMRRRRS